jgi:UDP-2-acetamido-3-amino-2,3-dideoxy-glucuronate N-acetyltransferase
MMNESIIESCSVRGVQLYEMCHVVDRVRGNLTVGEIAQDLPFVPQRWFMTYAIPSQQTRGEHAHRQCSQFLICVHGECHLRVEDGTSCEEFCLNRPTFGVLVPPMVWATEYLHSPDSVLLVLASHAYDAGDYIRDYREYLSIIEPSA